MQVPLERWDIERVYAPGLASDRMYARHAAWLGGVDRFDAALFGFSKAQATATDPQVCRSNTWQLPALIS